MWFRRDLRLMDNPALLAAIADARAAGDGRVVPLFVLDPTLWEGAGLVRQHRLLASLRALGGTVGRNLLIRHGNPRTVVPEIAQAAGASQVHVSADYTPMGIRRDEEVEASLAKAGIELIRTGSPYAVAPGRVRKSDGTPYRVYTPFYRAWATHGWRAPAADPPSDVDWWMPVECQGFPDVEPLPNGLTLVGGEEAAWSGWERFRQNGLAAYPEARDRPDIAGTSHLGDALKFGEIHPRSLLAELTDADDVFRKELCWREFYADVLFHNPHSVYQSLDRRFDSAMRWTEGKDVERYLNAWRTGNTGFPIVDAGMRQLLQEGWMHNRVRMITASFLVKDLHVQWQHGATHFMQHLRDGDTASNVHGWQWTAGCGTDAAPFFRIFNPISQGIKFDPHGDYVRRYVPELAHLSGKSVHEPWLAADGYAHGYVAPIVDHGTERQIALADYSAIKGVARD
jgi:deoxyribodipyrimidine photo-lyase